MEFSFYFEKQTAKPCCQSFLSESTIPRILSFSSKSFLHNQKLPGEYHSKKGEGEGEEEEEEATQEATQTHSVYTSSGHWPSLYHRQPEMHRHQEETRIASETFTTLSVNKIFSLPILLPSHLLLVGSL